MPNAVSRCSLFGPTPGSRLTSSGARNAASRPSGTYVIPPGFLMSDAILHTTLHAPTPSEAEMRHHSPSIPAVSAGISGQNRHRPCGLGAAAPVDSTPALTHDSDKLIRQLSLVAYLMAEQRPVTARDVKNNVEGYANMGDE